MSNGRQWPPRHKIWGFALLVSSLAVWLFWTWRHELWSVWCFLSQAIEHRESIREFIISQGPLAPLAFIALQSLQILISPIPGEATGFIGGFLFGKWLGFIYSTFGLTLGSAGAFFLSRQFRRMVKSRLVRSRIYNRFERLIEHQGLFIFLILFLFPGFPKDFLCYFLGLSRMPWQAFLAIATLGRMPGTLALTLQGANVYDGNIVGFLCILFISLIVICPAWYFRERIYQWVEAHSLKE